MENKTIIGITGASGFVGKNLVSYLSSRGFKVIAFGRTNASNSNIEFIRGDLKSIEDVKNFISKIDLCVHLASVLSEDGENNFNDNIIFAKNLNEAILSANSPVKLINISTLAVFNYIHKHYLERTKYAHSKLLADIEFHNASSRGLKLSTLYLGLVYGNGDQNFLPTIIKGLKGFKIYGIPFRTLMLKGSKESSPLIFVEDVSQLILETVYSSSFNGEKYLGIGSRESLYDCVCKTAEILKLKKPLYINFKLPFLVTANLIEWAFTLFDKKAPFFITVRSISVLGLKLNVDINDFDHNPNWWPKNSFEINVKKLL